MPVFSRLRRGAYAGSLWTNFDPPRPLPFIWHHPSVSMASWAHFLRISNAWRTLTGGKVAQPYCTPAPAQTPCGASVCSLCRPQAEWPVRYSSQEYCTLVCSRADGRLNNKVLVHHGGRGLQKRRAPELYRARLLSRSEGPPSP